MERGRGGEDRPIQRLALCLGMAGVGRDPGSCLFPRVWIRDPRNSSPKFSHKRNEGGGVGWAVPRPNSKDVQTKEPQLQATVPLSPLVRRSRSYCPKDGRKAVLRMHCPGKWGGGPRWMGRAGREHSGPQGHLPPAHPCPPRPPLPGHRAHPWASQSTTAPTPCAPLRPLLGGDTEPPLGEGSNTEHIMRPKAALSPQLYP